MEKKTQEKELQDNFDVFKSRGFQKIDKAVRQSIAIVKEAKLGNREVFPTSWPRLNRNLLGGLQRSNQLIFDVLDTNKNKKLIVLYWTFEMPGYQQVMRSASKDVRKEIGELLSVDSPLSDVDFRIYAAKVQKYGKYPIYFNNIPRTMEYIENTNRSLYEKDPETVVINLFDHSRLIRGNEETELRKLNTISKGCMLMQSEFGVINILLSQLNRNIEQEHRAKNQYQPLLTDLFGGDSIGQDAHVVMILNRPYDLYNITDTYCNENPKGLLACHLEKNRDGLLGMIGYEADMSTFTIKERK